MASKNKTVLITGVTGFIGAHVALKLLQAGFTVRGAVRSRKKGELLLQQPVFREYTAKFHVVEVPNIEETGAFDEAVKGVQVVVHLASPVVLEGGDPQSFIGPAKKGTISILQSFLKYAPPDFSHFVFMSSIAAMVRRDVAPGYVFTERDWNPLTEEVLQTMDPTLVRSIAYYASKTIAERALWDFMETHKPSWTASALNPAVVSGPFIHPVARPEELNDTVKTIWDIFSGTTNTIPQPVAAGAYVDVRDVAAVCVFAVEHPELVAGKRFPVVAGQGPPQAVADILREHYPERKDIIPEGTKGVGYRREDWQWAGSTISFSSKLIEETMRIEWIPFDKSVLDTVECFHQLS
ncbi:hypothetical protein VTN77DRAFT_9752 [Rasamsonia byssochlamydoides]|uniref:uncharacterized protein n=1 Tax=Rasamsonia byssochlamydoides TaxID=89139 RepID=UPI003742268D